MLPFFGFENLRLCDGCIDSNSCGDYAENEEEGDNFRDCIFSAGHNMSMVVLRRYVLFADKIGVFWDYLFLPAFF